PAILPDYGAVIFDEAHEIEEVATEYFGFRVSNFRISELMHDTRRMADKSEVRLDDLEIIQRAADRFFGAFALLGEGRHPFNGVHSRLDGIDGLIGALREGRRLLKNHQDFSGEWESLARRSGELSSELELFRDGIPENYVSWIERRGRGVF